jgi:hypothetical protein
MTRGLLMVGQQQYHGSRSLNLRAVVFRLALAVVLVME